jgi:hypothetical protein
MTLPDAEREGYAFTGSWGLESGHEVMKAEARVKTWLASRGVYTGINGWSKSKYAASDAPRRQYPREHPCGP